MKKRISFLAVFLLCLPLLIQAQTDAKYLAGAVPEVDGKVVFRRDFLMSGTSRADIYQRMHAWLTERMKKNDNNSRIVFEDKERGVIAAMGEEFMVFRSAALSLDRATINYQLSVTYDEGSCAVELERMRFEYENERFAAEEYVRDEVALNKTKTKMIRGYAKFRTKTIDFAESILEEAQTALSRSQTVVVTDNRPTVSPTAKVNIIEGNAPTPKVNIIEGKAPVAEVKTPVVIAQTSVPAAGRPTVSTDELPGYRRLLPDKIPGSIIKMLDEEWMLITAAHATQMNMMTASWGGLGMLYNKPVAFCFINPTRHTYTLMEKADTYTLSFYTAAYKDALQYCGTHSGADNDKVKGSGLTPITTPAGSQAFSEAWLIIECRKMVSQSLTPEAIADPKIKEEWVGKQLHKMYIGEIINVWVK